MKNFKFKTINMKKVQLQDRGLSKLDIPKCDIYKGIVDDDKKDLLPDL